MNKKIMKLKCNGEKPSYANEFAAGLDIRSNGEVVIKAGGTGDIETKLSVQIPAGHFGMVVPRSGIAFKHKINLINSIGIIDEDYRGELGIRLVNNSDVDYTVNDGDRVAQMIIIPYIQPTLEYVEELDETERNEGGFGSTGK